MRDEHYGAQNSTKIAQPRGNVNGIIFCANLCCTKAFLRNVIDREWPLNVDWKRYTSSNGVYRVALYTAVYTRTWHKVPISPN
jgi:hypothetical protein